MQLFVGPEGSGTLPMAIAYAQYIFVAIPLVKTMVKIKLVI
jgi:hypothetical protein